MRVLLAVSCIALAGCASPGTPPGGPVDTEAPKILRISPDSGATGVTPGNLVFHFDEVVSERPSGAASLSALFLISPSDGEPRVDWSRKEIGIKPRRGWRPNTAYSITVLPGISDLRGNIRNTGAVTMFSTGATIPAGRISGVLFNWIEGRPLARAIVQARPASDTTLNYLAATDSTGSFTVSNLPPGTYNVRGFSDENSNRGLDPREAWDSAVVQLADSATTELLAFVRDSVGTRLLSINVRDSVTLELTFDNPLSVTNMPTAATVSVTGPDSTRLQMASIAPPPPDTAAAGARRPSRPLPSRMMIVKLARPLVIKTTYRVRVVDAENLIGVKRTSDRTVVTPDRFAAPAAPAATPAAAPPPPAAAPPRRLED